jgi:Ca-activated chloride channel homolog
MGFSRKRPGRFFVLLAAASLLSALALAQTQTSAPPPAKINVLVLDRENHPVTSLKQEDFHLTEDGKPLTISSFSREEVPLSYGLVIDASGSLRSQMNKVILAAQNIVNGNKPEDETFVVSFVSRDNIAKMQDITRDKSKLFDALRLIRAEGGQTALIDAVYISADYLHKNQRPDAHSALILVTDGEERNSYYNQEQLFGHLRKSKIQVFIIGLISQLDKENGGTIRKSTRESAQTLLDKLAKETGGRVFYPKDDKDLESAAQEIMLDLRSQYVLGFAPLTPAKSGQYRKVEVKVTSPDDKNKLKAITRGGYLSP